MQFYHPNYRSAEFCISAINPMPREDRELYPYERPARKIPYYTPLIPCMIGQIRLKKKGTRIIISYVLYSFEKLRHDSFYLNYCANGGYLNILERINRLCDSSRYLISEWMCEKRSPFKWVRNIPSRSVNTMEITQNYRTLLKSARIIRILFARCNFSEYLNIILRMI